MVAQGAHASMAAILSLSENFEYEAENKQYLKLELDDSTRSWLLDNFKKICVYVNSEEQLLEIHRKAKEARILTSLIQDSGLTEFNGVPTYTAVAVGPGFSESIDKITGELPLL